MSVTPAERMKKHRDNNRRLVARCIANSIVHRRFQVCHLKSIMDDLEASSLSQNDLCTLFDIIERNGVEV